MGTQVPPLIGIAASDSNSALDETYLVLRDDTHETIVKAREFVEGLWQRFEPHADTNFRDEFKLHCQDRFWEMYLTVSLAEWATKSGYTMTCPKPGPDIRIQMPKQTVWVEAVSASPGQSGSANEVMRPPPRTVYTPPLNLMIARITNAVDEKRNKLTKYIANSIVGPSDTFLIAVNTGALPVSYRYMTGHCPLALRAMLPVGDLVLILDQETKRVVGQELKYNSSVAKLSGAAVSTEAFLNDEYRGVSAVLHSDADFANFSKVSLV
jgi:hypothetical protein